VFKCTGKVIAVYVTFGSYSSIIVSGYLEKKIEQEKKKAKCKEKDMVQVDVWEALRGARPESAASRALLHEDRQLQRYAPTLVFLLPTTIPFSPPRSSIRDKKLH
jgi:hypothetical protein